MKLFNMLSIKEILNQLFMYDYETKDPYIGMSLGAGWTYHINHTDISKGFVLSVSSFHKGEMKSYYNNKINQTDYKDIEEFTLDNKKVICGQNLPYDLGWYLAQKFKGNQKDALKYLRQMYLDGVLLLDTKILARLYDEHMMSVSLKAMAKMFKVTQKSEDTLADDLFNTGEYTKIKFEKTGKNFTNRPKENKQLLNLAYENLDRVTPKVVVDYCEDDVKATYELATKFIYKLSAEYSEEELLKLLQRYSTMLFLSVDMRLRGVPVHIETLRNAYKDVNIKLDDAKKDMMKLLRDYIKSADKEYMIKFLIQYYYHPQKKDLKTNLIKDIKSNNLSKESRKIWNKYEHIVYDFVHIVEENKFDELKFSGSSSHPALMFILSGYKKENFKRTKAGRLSTDKAWIEEQDNDLGKILNRVRKVEKILSGFIIPAMNTQSELQTLEQEYGIVYPEFVVAGAKSFRYSCSNPNLQQVPKRDPEFKDICRGMFHAPKGYALLAPDFSSQEQRLIIHIAYLLGAKGADKLRESFQKDPYMDFHTLVGEMVKLARGDAKGISLGKMYGMGELKLCKQLKLPTEWITTKDGKYIEVAGKEGKDIIAKYDRLMPFIKEATEILIQLAENQGYVKAACGRHVHPPYYIENFKRVKSYHKLLNYVTQGSAAGQLHLGLEKLYDFMCRHEYNNMLQLNIIGTVHDEILAVCKVNYKDKTKEILEDCMINAINLEVPVIVDTQIGQSWLGDDL